MKEFFKNATTRLFGRAVVAAGITAFVTAYGATQSGTPVVWQSLIVGAGLVFFEVFTPLNSLVGFFKQAPKP